MAQPIFDDEGPLDEYLRESGEKELMPGILQEFTLQDEDDDGLEFQRLLVNWLPPWLLDYIQNLELEHMLSSQAPSSIPSNFAERFKYVVITSSLLSTEISQHTISATIPTSFRRTPTPPTEVGNQVQLNKTNEFTSNDYNEPLDLRTLAFPFFLFTFMLALAGYIVTALLMLGSAKIYAKEMATRPLHSHSSNHALALSLDALQSLLDAESHWSNAITEAMSMLEREGTHSPTSPASPIRVALHSCLQTTTSQCDSIRQLFPPLTAPNELAPLAEMYAPASPAPYTLALEPSTTPQKHASTPLEFSYFLRQSRSSSILDKRSTWSGAPSPYSLSRTGSTRGVQKARLRESLLLEPGMPSPRLVVDSADSSNLDTASSLEDEGDAPFGVLALGVQRGLRRSQSQRYSLAVPLTRKSASVRSSPTAASRFTTLQTARNPLSLTALHHSLKTCLASKRYACAHLLALKFDQHTNNLTSRAEEEELEGYWDDVRSVMSLLITTLQDEASRLSEALDEGHRSRRRDEVPSMPNTPAIDTFLNAFPQPQGFAPMPSHISKYLSHTEAITVALDNAKKEMDESIVTLRKLLSSPKEDEDLHAKNVLDSYDRLRESLGSALRNCERARDPLLALLPSKNEEIDADDAIGVPALAIDRQSQSSASAGGLDSPPPANFMLVSREGRPIGDDDASNELIAQTGSSHLPLPGIEAIFEGENIEPPKGSIKPPSNLSRAERIAIVKAQREEAKKRPLMTRPGGEIVEELKQVINRVQQKKLARLSAALSQTTTVSPPPPDHLPPLLAPVGAEGDRRRIGEDSLMTSIPSFWPPSPSPSHTFHSSEDQSGIGQAI